MALCLFLALAISPYVPPQEPGPPDLLLIPCNLKIYGLLAVDEDRVLPKWVQCVGGHSRLLAWGQLGVRPGLTVDYVIPGSHFTSLSLSFLIGKMNSMIHFLHELTQRTDALGCLRKGSWQLQEH